MGYRVFIKSPDDTLKRSLGEQLIAKGFALSPDLSGADLLLLDGGEDPAARCQEIRGRRAGQPILLLGAAPAAARAAGADAGLAKPFRFNDLLRGLEQISRSVALTIGSFRLDANAREIITSDGSSFRLTEKETAILAYLARAGDQAVAREELLGEVWGYSGGATTHTVETHIYRLRRKLDRGGGGALLVTEAGGYRIGSTGG